jgi:hypothetical protein
VVTVTLVGPEDESRLANCTASHHFVYEFTFGAVALHRAYERDGIIKRAIVVACACALLGPEVRMIQVIRFGVVIE